MFRRNSETASLEEYDGTEWKVVGGTVEVSVSGTAVFTNTDNNIELTNIGDIGLEVGDVIQVSGSTNNDTEFTVEVITDADNVIVNAAHAGGTSTKSLVDETVSVTVTLLVKAKSAGLGVGQAWKNVMGARAGNVTYTNTTGKTIMVSVFTTSSVTYTVTVDGVNVVYIASADTVSGSCFAVPDGSSYKLGLAPPGIAVWSELR